MRQHLRRASMVKVKAMEIVQSVSAFIGAAAERGRGGEAGLSGIE